jgi:HAD superfamily hydrolase (TIGR01509 family)
MSTKSVFIFDLDGVISKTQKLHAIAWKTSINKFLLSNSSEKVFSDKDYLMKFDGRPRVQAISDFLDGINYKKNKNQAVEWISKDKNIKFIDLLNQLNREELLYKDSMDFINKIKSSHRLALASSSKNAIQVVKKLKLINYFSVIIDGLDVERLSLRGKPAPDIFNLCAEKLEDSGLSAVILEDSISGVTAALNSKVKYVIWVQREECDSQDMKKLARIKCKDLQIVKHLNQINLT